MHTLFCKRNNKKHQARVETARNSTDTLAASGVNEHDVLPPDE